MRKAGAIALLVIQILAAAVAIAGALLSVINWIQPSLCARLLFALRCSWEPARISAVCLACAAVWLLVYELRLRLQK